MNNASLLLNAARPASPAHAPAAAPATTSVANGDDHASARKGFDHAMDAARADAHKPAPSHDAASNRAASDKAATKAPAKAPTDKPAAKADDSRNDDTAAKKDDDSDDKDAGNRSDDTSLAASMLALIGVPAPVAQVAASALGAAKDALMGKAGDAVAAATGAAGDPAAVKPGALDTLAAGTAAATGTGATTPASPFAALLPTAGAATHSDKDDAKGIDLAATGPMPLAHAQPANQLNGPIQVQATHAATSPQFSQELGEQIAWMSSAAGDVKEARIKLHPEELGSMDVRVSVDGGKVNVAIMAQHPAAVHAVQQTLSNLDSMLAHHGLSLGQAEVNQGNAGQGGGSHGQAQGGGASQGDNGDETMVTAATSRVSRGLVDEVA